MKLTSIRKKLEKSLALALALIMLAGIMPMEALAEYGLPSDENATEINHPTDVIPNEEPLFDDTGEDPECDNTDNSYVDTTMSVYDFTTTAAITRVEWVRELVKLFDMTVNEDSMPDDYFFDIERDSPHWLTVMTATAHGVIDLEAGESFFPNNPVTREFAASTMNYCLGFQVDETRTINLTDMSGNDNRDDAWVAVRRGWFGTPVAEGGSFNGAFLPNEFITAAQMTTMLNDAKEVLASRVINPNHTNSFTFSPGIIVVPVNTDVSYDNGVVTIINNPTPISAGQNFIAFYSGLPVAYTAQNVSVTGNVTRIDVVEIDVSDFVIDADVQGDIDADLTYFEPHNDEETITTLTYIVGGTFDMNFEDGTEYNSLATISPASVNAIRLEGKLSLGSGRSVSVTGVISNVRASVSGNIIRREAYVSITGNTSVSVGANFDLAEAAGNRATLGSLRIKGVGVVRIFFEVSLEGSVSIVFENSFEIGFQYSPREGFSAIRHFTERRSSIQGSVTASAHLELEVGIDIFFANATVYARVGARASHTRDNLGDNTPPRCTTTRAYIFVRVGVRGTLFGLSALTWDVHHYFWNEDNSPVRIVRHTEDGVRVDRCARGTNIGFSSDGSSRFGPGGGGSGGTVRQNWRNPGTTVTMPVFTYTVSNNQATITGFTGTTSTLLIPSVIDGFPVVAIGSQAFRNRNDLVMVVIPDSVISIDSRAFANCTNLSSVTLSKNLDSLGQEAFLNTAITSIEIPRSLRTITNVMAETNSQHGPFRGCTQLKNVTFEEGTTRIVQFLLLSSPGIESIEIPDTVTTIEQGAFRNATGLTGIVIPDSVTSIGSGAFQGATALRNVTLSNNLTSISSSVFRGCALLQAINLPDGLQSIGNNAFQDARALQNITIPSSVTSIGSRAFQDCRSLQTATVLSSGSIGADAFRDNKALHTLFIADTVTSIGARMAQGCDNLANLTLGQYIPTIPDSAFRLCPALVNITIPRFTTTIAANAFAENTGLRNVYIPPRVTSIQTNSFSFPAWTTIHGIPSSTAQTYANSRGMTFVPVNAPITSLAFKTPQVNADRNRTFFLPLDISPGFDTDTLTFSSSNTNVATVNAATGSVSTRNVFGTAIITVTNGTLSATATITVAQTSEFAVTVTGGTGSGNFMPGATVTITANADSAGNRFREWEITPDVTFTGGTDKNSRVARFLMPALAVTATAVFSALEPQTISFPEASVTVDFGVTAFTGLEATLAGSGGDGAVTYSSNNTSVATVNTATGTVTIVGMGTATITATKAACNEYLQATASYTLTVRLLPPVITTHPLAQELSVGQSAAFTVATEDPSLGITQSHQWQISINNGAAWSNITGATSADYTTPALTISDDGNRYRCVVTNTMGANTSSTTSNAAILTVYYDYMATPDVFSAELPGAYWYDEDGAGEYLPEAPTAVITFTNTGRNPLTSLQVSLGKGAASDFIIADISANSDLLTPAAIATITDSISEGDDFTVTIKPKDARAVGNYTDELTLSGGSLPYAVNVSLSFNVFEPAPPVVIGFQTMPRNLQAGVCPSQQMLTIPFDMPMRKDMGMVSVRSETGHVMTFDLGAPNPDFELNWSVNEGGDVLALDLSSHPNTLTGLNLNYGDAYVVTVSRFRSMLNVEMDEPHAFAFTTREQNNNGGIRRITLLGQRVVINNATQVHTVEIPFGIDLDTIIASDFDILLDTSLSNFNTPVKVNSNEWRFGIVTDIGIPEVIHTVMLVQWAADDNVGRDFTFGIDYENGTVILGTVANRGLWYFVAGNQHVVPVANNFTQLGRNHATGRFDLNSALNASTSVATRILYVLDWTETNSRPNAAQFNQAVADGKLMSIPLLRRATAADLNNIHTWHYEYGEYADWEAGDSRRTVHLTGDIYDDTAWELRSSNSTTNDNNLLARGTGKGRVNQFINFESLTPAQRNLLAGTGARNLFVRLTGDNERGLFASHTATLNIVADSTMTGNAGMNNAGNVSRFVNYAFTDTVNGTSAVWTVPDGRYSYEYIMRETTPLRRPDGNPGTVPWSPTHPDVIDSDAWQEFEAGDPLPGELFSYNTVANLQFHVRRKEHEGMEHPRSAPSAAFRFAPLRAPVNLAARNINVSTMNITGRQTAQEYIVLSDVYSPVSSGDNRMSNTANHVLQNWTRVPGANIPIRAEWAAQEAYIYVRIAATSAAPAGMVGTPARLTDISPTDLLGTMSDDERNRTVNQLFVFNLTNGRISMNTLNNLPPEARAAGYTNRSPIQISSGYEFWVTPGSTDLRGYLHSLDSDEITLWVRISGARNVRPSMPMLININIRTGVITSA
jgi:hypothetical protein